MAGTGSKKTQFKKGKSGNPGGGKALSAEVREFKKTSYEDFCNGVQAYGEMTKKNLKAEIKRDDIRAFDLIFARVVDQAGEGEKDARAVLLDRLWGKPKETDIVPFAAEQELMKRIPIAELVELARKYQDKK